MNDRNQEKVMSILNEAQGNTLDICYTLLCECVLPADNPGDVIAQILQNNRSIGTQDAPPDKIDEAVRDRVGKKYYRLLRETVRLIMGENLSTHVFYKKLYEQVFASSIFPENNEERAVILWLLVEKIPEFPYYQAKDLLEKSNKEYRRAIERINSQLHKAIHMFNRHFATRTEEASQLYRISMEIENEEDRIVYWAALFSIILKEEEKATKS